MTDQEPYTKIPNALLEVLATLPDAECRVMLVIIRKTAGWQKACDVISYSQLATATGMSRQGAINGVEGAIKRGILKRTPSGFNNGFCYEVVNEVDHLKQSTKQTSQRSRPLVVNEVDHQVVNEVDPQKKRYKEKKEKIVGAAQAPPPTTDHQRLMQLYAGVLPDKRIPNGATEGKAAKAILAAGYTPEQAIEVYTYLKRRDFWRDQHLSLASVNKQMGAVLHALKVNPNGSIRQTQPNNGRHPDPRAEWPGFTEADYDKPF